MYTGGKTTVADIRRTLDTLGDGTEIKTIWHYGGDKHDFGLVTADGRIINVDRACDKVEDE